MRECVIFVAAAGLLLIACFPTKAQTSATQFALEQPPPDLNVVLFPAPRVRLSSIALPIQLFAEPFPNPAFLLDTVHEPDPSLENRLPMESFDRPVPGPESSEHSGCAKTVLFCPLANHPY
jgi:hypothetical protein